MTCEILIHRNGTTCPDTATEVVINRIAYCPKRVVCCTRHAARFNAAYWRREALDQGAP